MKKYLLTAFTIILLLVITGCGNEGAKATNQETPVTLKISASSIPHAEILEFIAEDLKEKNIELDVSITTDGIQTNVQTAEGQFDANFFQHLPYLEQVNRDSDLDLVSVKGVHIEPFGLYSKQVETLEELPENAQISLPKDPVNFSRALILLAANDVIELAERTSGDYTLEDITKNEKNFSFIGVDAAMLVHSLDDVDAAAINANYALEGGFNPLEEALIIEGNESPYVNILVSRPEHEHQDAIDTLADLLTTDKVRQFIQEEYKGAVVPVF